MIYKKNLLIYYMQKMLILLTEKFADALTHLSLASLLLDKGKQNSPRCDAAERGVPPIWGYSLCTEKFHRKMR